MTPSDPGPVTFFRPRRGGPECAIEDHVIDHLPALFSSAYPAWMAGSVPLGAGMPDLIVAAYQALVASLAGAGAVETNILAYLRVVSRARPDTIATRLRLSPKIAERDEHPGVPSRCYRRARPDTIATRLRLSPKIAERDRDGNDLCLKIVAPTYERVRLDREIVAMQTVDHPNVVGLYESVRRFTYQEVTQRIDHCFTNTGPHLYYEEG